MKLLVLLISILIIIGCEDVPRKWYNDIPDEMSDYELYKLIEEHYKEYEVYKVSTQKMYILIPTDTIITDSINSYVIGLKNIKYIERYDGTTPDQLRQYSTHQYDGKTVE